MGEKEGGVELLRKPQGALRTKTVLVSPCSPQLDGDETDIFSGDWRVEAVSGIWKGTAVVLRRSHSAELLDAHSPVTGKGQSGPIGCCFLITEYF